MGFNKGEWSELYTFLYLLLNPNLAIVDEHLKVVDNSLFQVVEIVSKDKSYKIDKKRVIKINSDGKQNEYNLTYLSHNNKLLLQKIQTHTKVRGSFEIDEIKPLVDDFFDGKKPKGSSRTKGDLNATLFDRKLHRSVNLSYNIKSNLGRPATLLNASSHTNFIYEVSNIDDKIMEQNNAIEGRKKLLQRYQFLTRHGAKIAFYQVESQAFDYNLKMIDSNLDKLLAQMLLLSYQENQKDILKLLEMMHKSQDEYIIATKKTQDFANAVTFGMRASQKWSGVNEVKGGILLVMHSGKVYLLDLIYFKEMVNRYLINNIKLESPSSRRYKMFEIYKDDGKYYFKLNLQIRFK
ncbi:MAG: HpaII family restriction endonuclease [Campylobacterales bacterium]|nr:HpaII family restriction endonuclease [Campylobacterales bacterium]